MAEAKRSELTLVALMLLGCFGAILFVFYMMSNKGGAFELQEAEPPRNERSEALPPPPDMLAKTDEEAPPTKAPAEVEKPSPDTDAVSKPAPEKEGEPIATADPGDH